MEKMLITSKEDLITPIDEVAVIYEHHSLDHALLVMTAQKWSVMPVIDRNSKMRGLISIQQMMSAIMDIDDINFNQLSEMKVSEAMQTKYPFVLEDFELEDVLHQLVDASFISVVNDNGILTGIITRSEILKGTIRIVHDFERVYMNENK